LFLSFFLSFFLCFNNDKNLVCVVFFFFFFFLFLLLILPWIHPLFEHDDDHFSSGRDPSRYGRSCNSGNFSELFQLEKKKKKIRVDLDKKSSTNSIHQN